MKTSTYNPCLLYNYKPFGIITLQTDDTLFLVNIKFVKQEAFQLEKTQFVIKEHQKLTTNNPLKFNSKVITLQNDSSITLTQEH
jgi:hypothetical protein